MNKPRPKKLENGEKITVLFEYQRNGKQYITVSSRWADVRRDEMTDVIRHKCVRKHNELKVETVNMDFDGELIV